MWQGRGMTLYDTIEEQEVLKGTPQRGIEANVENQWSSYF
jgi:hypothetical protein